MLLTFRFITLFCLIRRNYLFRQYCTFVSTNITALRSIRVLPHATPTIGDVFRSEECLSDAPQPVPDDLGERSSSYPPDPSSPPSVRSECSPTQRPRSATFLGPTNAFPTPINRSQMILVNGPPPTPQTHHHRPPFDPSAPPRNAHVRRRS